MTRYISDEILLLTRTSAKDFPQAFSLDKIFIIDLLEELVDCGAAPLFVSVGWLYWLVGDGPIGAGVVGVGAIVAMDGHCTITLERIEEIPRGADGDLLVIDSKTMTVGVGIGKEPRLEDRID
jgi:hypothetical protein